MKEKSITLFKQQVKNHITIRLSLINKAISDYAEARGLPVSVMKQKCQRINADGSELFHYEGDLIISVRNGFVFNGFSYNINYQINDILVK